MEIMPIADKRMEPNKGRVIVAVNPQGHKEHAIELAGGEAIKIELQKHFDWDKKYANIMYGKLMHDYKQAVAGEEVVFNHNALMKECDITDYVEGLEKGWQVFVIEEELVNFFIRDGQAHCFEGCVMVDRLYEPPKVTSSILFIPSDENKKQIRSKFLVKAAPPNSEVYVGDVVVAFHCSDYEMSYIKDGVTRKYIRIKSRDIIGKDHGLKKSKAYVTE